MSDSKTMLSKIEKGMKLFDNKSAEVGMVEFVHFSEAGGARHTGAASLPDDDDRNCRRLHTV
jgi:hypothetical protein